jgi:ABC-type Zn uptake system ZnuABC Zn-binding protein ZnuA
VGVGAPHLQAVLLGLIALATTAALSVIGALLVAALFVIPAATTRLLASRMWSWQVASVALVAAEGTVGLWLSVKTDAPPGATIATLSGAVFVLVALARALPQLRRGIAVSAAAVALASVLAGCGASSSSDSGKLQVVATTTQIGDFVRAVGGDAVAVDQILQPNTDPHEYEPRPSDIEGAAGAKLVFANGDNLDTWIGDVVSESGSNATIVDLGAGVPVKLAGESSGAEASQYDSHWWHNPRNAAAAVRRIRDGLEKADPSAAGRFRRAAAAYLGQLRALDRGIARCMDSVPAVQRKLVTDHDAFGYFAERYGISVVGAVIPSQTTQAQPSAKDVSNLVNLIEREHVSAVFPESSLSPKLAQAIGDRSGASSDLTLYGDTLGPADSSGATYLRMEAANADAMVRGFTGGQRGCHIAGVG